MKQKIFRQVSRSLHDTLSTLGQEGWNMRLTNGGHLRLTHPSASRPIYSGTTPSCSRAPLNLLAECRRAVRIEQEATAMATNAEQDNAVQLPENVGVPARRKDFRSTVTFPLLAGLGEADEPGDPQICAQDAGPDAISAEKADDTQTHSQQDTSEKNDMMTDAAQPRNATATTSKARPASKPAPVRKKVSHRPKAAPMKPESPSEAISLEGNAFSFLRGILTKEASGDALSCIEITSDMVGGLLVTHEGKTFLLKRDMSDFVKTDSRPVSAACSIAQTTEKRRNVIMDTLKAFENEWLRVSEILALIDGDLFGSTQRSQDTCMRRLLDAMTRDALLESEDFKDYSKPGRAYRLLKKR